MSLIISLFILFSKVSAAEIKTYHLFGDYGTADKITSLGNNNTYDYFVGNPIGLGGGYRDQFDENWFWVARFQWLFAMRMDVYAKNGNISSFTDSGIFDVLFPSGNVQYFLNPMWYLFGGLNFSLPISDVAKSVTKNGAIGWQGGVGFLHATGCFFELEMRNIRYFFRIEQESYFDTTQFGFAIRGGYFF